MKTKVILTVLALIATIGLISAQNTKAETSKSASKKTCYVDANNNNVCDNYENKTCTQGNGKVNDKYGWEYKYTEIKNELHSDNLS